MAVEFYCQVCNITLYDQVNFEKHLNGGPHQVHARNITEESIRGELNENSSLKTGRMLHEQPSEFKARIEEGKRKRSHSDGASTSPSSSSSSSSVFRRPRYERNRDGFYCRICDVTTKTEDVMDSHYSGKSHSKRAKVHERFECTLCRVETGSKESLKSHLNGQAHLRRERMFNLDNSSSSRGHNSPQEHEELLDLRSRVQKLEKENKNLQEDLRRLMRFKQNCVENHERKHDVGAKTERDDEEIFFQQIPDVKPKNECLVKDEKKYSIPPPPPTATATLYIDPMTRTQFKREPRGSKSDSLKEEETEIVILDDD